MTCGLVTAMLIAASWSLGEPVRVGAEAAYPPYTDLGPDGEIVGFDRDIGDEACRRADLDCRWTATAFDRLIPGVVAGEFDLVISSLAATPERAAIVDLTVPYWTSDGTDDFLGRPGAPAPESARIGVQSGTIHADHLAATGRAFEPFQTMGALLEALAAGRVDLAYGAWDDAVLTEMQDRHGIVPLYQETLATDGVVMAVCKGNDALRDKLDTAITAMWEDGTIDAISARWFD